MRSAPADPMVMMRPPFLRWGIAAFAARTGPRTLTASSASISSTVKSAIVLYRAIAALLTRMSRPPSARTVSSTDRWMAEGSALSACSATALPPFASIVRTSRSALSTDRSYVIATFAPFSDNAIAIASPMPRDPPVTSAFFPASSCIIIPFAFSVAILPISRSIPRHWLLR